MGMGNKDAGGLASSIVINSNQSMQLYNPDYIKQMREGTQTKEK